MDLVSKQTDEALGWAAESAKAVEDAPQVNTDLSFKDAATFVASATPVIGDAMAAKEVYDELNKEDPNYFLAGALGGAAVIGLVPGLGDAAANAIRAGAKKAAETVKRVEVDPNALGSMGGNIRLKGEVGTGIPKVNMIADTPAGLDNKTVTQSAVDLMNEPAFGEGFAEKLQKVAAENSIAAGDKTFSPMQVYTELKDRVNSDDFTVVPSKPRVNEDLAGNPQLDNAAYTEKMSSFDVVDDVTEWKDNVKKFIKESRDVDPVVRTPELEDAAQKLVDKEITRQDYLQVVDKNKPVTGWDQLPREPSTKAMVYSLKPNQVEGGSFVLSPEDAFDLGVNQSSLSIGDFFDGRLDVTAYKEFDTWIVAGAKQGEKGQHYAKAIHYQGGDGKPVILLNSDKPKKYESNIKTGERIGSAQKNPKGDIYGKTPYAAISGYIKDLDVDSIRKVAAELLNDPQWVQLGFDPRRQGNFYVRKEKSNAPLHAVATSAEEVIQIGPLVLAKNPVLDLDYQGYNKGGMAMDEQTRMAFALGGSVEDVDPVSGNEVPPGSLPEEVRDDIDARLSEGEYVVPADVVRFYGVKFFEDLRTQAKEGFADMEANGRIGGEPLPPEGMEMVEPEGEDFPFDISELQTVAEDQPMVNMKDGGYLKGYNEGGFEAPAAQGIPDVSSIFETNFMADNIEYKVYTDPRTGAKTTLRFVNGVPDAAAQALIDIGYTASEGSDSSPEVEIDQPDTGESSSVNPNSEVSAFKNEEEKVKAAENTFKDYSDDDLFSLAEKLGDPKVNKAITGISSFAGPVGLIASIGKRVAGFSVARELEKRYKLAKTDEDRDKIQKLFDGVTTRGKEREKGIAGGGGLLGGGGILQDVDGSGTVDFGDTWLGDMLGFDVGGSGIQGPSQSDSWDGARRTGGTGSKANLDLGKHVGAVTKDDITKPAPKPSSNRDNGPSLAEKMSNTAKQKQNEKAAKEAKEQSAPSYSGSSEKAKATSQKTESELESSYGMLNKGGLMKKNKKKK